MGISWDVLVGLTFCFLSFSLFHPWVYINKPKIACHFKLKTLLGRCRPDFLDWEFYPSEFGGHKIEKGWLRHIFFTTGTMAHYFPLLSFLDLAQGKQRNPMYLQTEQIWIVYLSFRFISKIYICKIKFNCKFAGSWNLQGWGKIFVERCMQVCDCGILLLFCAILFCSDSTL